MINKPNVVFVFSDQHRAEAVGYAGNKDVFTPNLDTLCCESISFITAVSGNPVCCAYRGSLMTGQYPLTHGVFVNDVYLSHKAVSIADAFSQAGYDTAYIGKWHLDGHGRSNFIPKERRQGFKYWNVLECTHDYNKSYYYEDGPTRLKWEGYDAEEQTRRAKEYILQKEGPFALFLSWGPPHNPYDTAPQHFKALYDETKLKIRPNVPVGMKETIRGDIAGYYAHITALDSLVGVLLDTIKDKGIEDNTIFIYTSDHGDMLGSQGEIRKQKPWDESILVPFLLKYPALFGNSHTKIDLPINTPDIMPTLLGLCGIEIPETVEGINIVPYLKGEEQLDIDAALIECIHPAGEWCSANGGKEYRGIRTKRYTYVRDIEGPWLLYDNENDPYQLNNLCNNSQYEQLQKKMELKLAEMLKTRGDMFQTGEEYINMWGYKTDETGTVPYEP